MRKVIVTGFVGYIAGNLVQKLVEKNYYVRGYDRMVPEDYYFDDKFLGTVTDISKGIYKDDDALGVIHLAAVSGIANCERNVTDAIKSNIESTLNILNYAREIEVPVVLASSQAAENGGNLYADTKKICEEIAQISNGYPGGDVKVLRFANVYGGKGYLEKKNTALANFIRCKLAGESAEVHGDGSQYRDFIHVDDVCNAIILALECERSLLRPVDIGTGVKTPVLQLARDIVQCGYTLRGDISAGVEGNVADTERAKELLGFVAQKKIENVMEEYE